MDSLFKPFELLLGLVEKHGYARSLFVLILLVALVVVPIYFGRVLLVGSSNASNTIVAPVTIPEIDIASEIQKRQRNILSELAADFVFIQEYFLNPTTDVRGFDPGGSFVHNYAVNRTNASIETIPMGFRVPFGTPADPTNFLPGLLENFNQQERFIMFPDTVLVDTPEKLPGIRSFAKYSFYAIGGFDLEGRLVLTVQIAFQNEKVILTEDDLRRSADDVQAIVALLE